MTCTTIEIRYYDSYRDVERAHKATIMKTLGIVGGVMRRNAKLFYPPVCVAFEDGEPVGWCMCLNYSDGRRTKDVQIFVRPKVRRRGVGTRLLKEMAKRFPSIQRIYETQHRPFNKPGRAFFDNWFNPSPYEHIRIHEKGSNTIQERL